VQAARSGFSASDLSLAPLVPLPNAKCFRRRYPRVRLAQPIPAIASVGQDSYRLEIRGLSLSGGIAAGEKHLQPGTLVSMKIGSSLRPIRAQVLMCDARAHGPSFEFADMDLDERARLRKLLLENKSSAIPAEQEVPTQTAARSLSHRKFGPQGFVEREMTCAISCGAKSDFSFYGTNS
jgi:hypothetical protein